MREPSFWHEKDKYARRAAPLTRALLTPVAALYAHFGARRIRNAEPHQAGIPVICVGNLTVGGSGKTPIVAALRAMLEKQGHRAASLSRGYKGELDGPLRVDVETHIAREVGDEPLMLAASGEAWIGADRVGAAKAMEAAGVQVIIMDDGHQNPTLQKDISLVVIDGGNPVGNGFVFPKGPLREPVASGLSRADAVLVVGDIEHPPQELFDFNPVWKVTVEPTGAAPEGLLLPFAGIGRPQKFFDSLAAAGAELTDASPYPDHHTYTPNDLRYLRELAEHRGARLITTEKDFVRLPKMDRDGILTFPVQAVFDESALTALLEPLFRVKINDS